MVFYEDHSPNWKNVFGWFTSVSVTSWRGRSLFHPVNLPCFMAVVKNHSLWSSWLVETWPPKKKRHHFTTFPLNIPQNLYKGSWPNDGMATTHLSSQAVLKSFQSKCSLPLRWSPDSRSRSTWQWLPGRGGRGPPRFATIFPRSKRH